MKEAYVWGNTVNGELGLGGIEEEFILTPRLLNHEISRDLKYVACGINHTLFLTDQGKVYSCGNNDFGQLGHQELPNKRPQFVAALESQKIVQIACGAAHSLALTEWGQVYSWGSNSLGQLGIDSTKSFSQPKIVKTLVTKHVVQIVCGHYHSIVLTNTGELYGWGSNVYGQLGLGIPSESVPNPTLIKTLVGLPIAVIACGANHSFALSKSSAVFGWGKNTFGQLGVQDCESKLFPTQLRSLKTIGVRNISCGDDFSVFLTGDGGVFTCGLGAFGQLGHGLVKNEMLPRKVVELMGSTISQVSCGGRHTLALVPSRGKVYGFGLGGSGQLGTKVTRNSNIPQLVAGPWAPLTATDSNDNPVVLRIFAGGDHCVIVAGCNESEGPDDYRVFSDSKQIMSLSIEIASTCAEIPADSVIDLDLITTLETIFKHQTCLNGSFLGENEMHLPCTSSYHGVDIDIAETAFVFIQKIENLRLKQLIWDSITNDLLKCLTVSPAHVEALRVYLILPLYHEFVNSKNYLRLHSPFSEALFKLNEIPQRVVRNWWSAEREEYFEKLVESFKGVVSYIITFNLKKEEDVKIVVRYERNLAIALKMLALLFELNHKYRLNRVPYEMFHLSDLHDSVDIQRDYVEKLVNKNLSTFHLCDYPFIFDVSAKTLLLQTDQHIQMEMAIQHASHQQMMMYLSGAPVSIPQFMVLNVTRENLVIDTIRELHQYTINDYKKPLKIKFYGEEAEDAGGVRKEFFMLLLKEILDPKYGMFKEYEEARYIWFADITFEGEQMYGLIGFLCGLAIYNFTIINLPFPLALFKKILKEPVDISDLKELSPTIGKSMQQILDYKDDDLEDVFCLTFSITQEVYGEVRTIQLKPNGDQIPVTQENKREFVELYIDFVFNKSAEGAFNAFYKCFHDVCGGNLLNLFRPHELMGLVVGNDNYDWEALESGAGYKNGYKSGDKVVLWFWEVFHELPLVEKKKFLLYLTGSDRVPIQGMKGIKIVIQPIADDRMLPVAHTCFNLLDLPRYSTKEKLKYKLQQAIQQTQGFSLV